MGAKTIEIYHIKLYNGSFKLLESTQTPTNGLRVDLHRPLFFSLNQQYTLLCHFALL